MTANQPIMTTPRKPYSIYLAQTLPTSVQDPATALLQQLPTEYIANIQPVQAGTTDAAMIGKSVIIKNMVDGRGLACPMPLLKTKVALRDVNSGESLYVVATDPNSQADILAFCQQTQQSGTQALTLILNQVTHSGSNRPLNTAKLDTIFHFIITKTDTN